MKATAFLAVLMLAGIAALGTRLADLPYRKAERFYQAGDYEKASIWCEKILQVYPSHAPARALFTEVQFLLGYGKPGAPVDYSPYMTKLPLSVLCLKEMDDALARVEETGDEVEWRKVLEYAKWLPDGVEVRARTDQARAYLECVSGSATSAR